MPDASESGAASMLVAGWLLDARWPLPRLGWLRVTSGRIAAIGEGDPPGPADLGGADALVSPGFVDAHVHLPQMPLRGCDGLDLLTWLDRVIYPAEAAWADPASARAGTELALRRLLTSGTTAAAAYLSSHPHAAEILRDLHPRWPIQLRAGVALMDRNAPEALRTGAVPLPPPLGTDDGRLQFTVNPRFALSCSPSLLRAAAHAADAGHGIQTHLAEQLDECERVRAEHPEAPHYAGVYDGFGLVRPGTLLAHGVHLGDDEWRLITERDAVVVHCPGANTFLGSGAFDLGAARRHGVRLALGSDVAAGPDVAMPRVARAMIEVAKLRRATIAADAPVPTPREAWHMITCGNADALGLPRCGRLEVGADADLLVLRTPWAPASGHDEHLYGRLVHAWEDAFIAARVLGGTIIDPDALLPCAC